MEPLKNTQVSKAPSPTTAKYQTNGWTFLGRTCKAELTRRQQEHEQKGCDGASTRV